MKIFRRTYIAKFAMDLLLACGVCVFLAFYLRLEGRFLSYSNQIPPYIFITAISLLLVEVAYKLPLRSWRSTGIPDLVTLFKAMVIFGLSVSGLCFIGGTSSHAAQHPHNKYFSGDACLGRSRALFRLYHEQHGYKNSKSLAEPKNILIAGAGEAGTMIAREMLRHPEAGLKPKGFLMTTLQKRERKSWDFPSLAPLILCP